MRNLKHTVLAAALALGFSTAAAAAPACPAYEAGLMKYTLNAFTQDALLQEFTERGTKPGFALEPFVAYRIKQSFGVSAGEVGSERGYATAVHTSAWLSVKNDAQANELVEREARLTRLFYYQGNPCFEYARDVKALFTKFVAEEYAKIGSLQLDAEDYADLAKGIPDGELVSYAMLVFLQGDLQAQRDFENKALNGITLPKTPKDLAAAVKQPDPAVEEFARLINVKK